MPTMLRRWQRGIGVGAMKPAEQPPTAIVASPADQGSEIAELRRELDRTRMVRDIQKGRRHLCGDATMRFNLIEQHAATYPVRAMCRVLGVLVHIWLRPHESVTWRISAPNRPGSA